MSRRLAEMTEETMETGGRSARRAIRDAGFSEDLRKELEDKIAKASFRAENQQAFSIAEAPSYAGGGTLSQAAAQPWTGNEKLEDSALRMLDDAHKPLRVPRGTARPPSNVNLRPAPKAPPRTAGQRLVNARDKTSIYALSQDPNLTEKEREQMRKDLKERFSPGARTMPMTVTGLSSLANERIEDAIARGQFRNIQRGKGVNIERDYNASSPFLDTTEYFMNKIIQKQEIVPPWIEKQQELTKAAHTFRSRLKHDWRRHASRVIASQGGSLAEQVRRAKAYALAEERRNPLPVRRESLSQIDSQGNLIGSIVIEETEAPVVEAQPGVDASQSTLPTAEAIATSTITVTEQPPATEPESEATPVVKEQSDPSPDITISTETPVPTAPQTPSETIVPASAPFRDPAWISLESAYHNLAVSNLNSLTRSYNLMAPKVAQKPYFNLQRELDRCYAEVAPQLAAEIEQRARAPRVKVDIQPHKPGGVMERFSKTERVRVHDEKKEKFYGWKDFWRDLWNSGGAKA